MPRTDEESAAVRAGLAVGLAAAAYGVSYGALAVAAGLDIWQTCVMSLLMFTGGSQFALIGVLASGGVASGGSAIGGEPSTRANPCCIIAALSGTDHDPVPRCSV